jgi:hypothetical protein
MSLPGNVRLASPNLLGFDSNTVITASTAAELFARNFRFCLRYVSRTAEPDTEDLSTAEALDILDAGLALMPIQHVHPGLWVPTPEMGSSCGSCAAAHVSAVGFPPGVNVWCDLEEITPGTPPRQVIDYLNAWYDAVAAAGYVPGLYVGANYILNSQALRFDLKFAHYWKSLSTVPPIPGRGYQMLQASGDIFQGVGYDIDRTQADELGGAVLFLSAAAAEMSVAATA